jgi:hypothetical protein
LLTALLNFPTVLSLLRETGLETRILAVCVIRSLMRFSVFDREVTAMSKASAQKPSRRVQYCGF